MVASGLRSWGTVVYLRVAFSMPGPACGAQKEGTAASPSNFLFISEKIPYMGVDKVLSTEAWGKVFEFLNHSRIMYSCSFSDPRKIKTPDKSVYQQPGCPRFGSSCVGPSPFFP
jgi:hypothetical protein